MSELNRIVELIESSSVPASISNGQFRIVVTNEPYNQMVGRSSDELVGEMAKDYLVGEKTDINVIKNAVERMSEGTPFDFSFEAYRGSGETFFLKDFVIPFVDGGDSVPYFISICSEGSELNTSFMENTSPEIKKLIGEILEMVQVS